MPNLWAEQCLSSACMYVFFVNSSDRICIDKRERPVECKKTRILTSRSGHLDLSVNLNAFKDVTGQRLAKPVKSTFQPKGSTEYGSAAEDKMFPHGPTKVN